MRIFWEYLYSFVVIPLLWVVLRSAGLVNRKVRRGITGRTGLFTTLERQVGGLAPGLRVWFHASSLGEFEQAKPIIAALKARHPGTSVIATFFSPSGYENSRKYALADVISYLPFDTRGDARRFLTTVRPDVAVMVRYDIWPNHIWELRRQGIPVMIANATMSAQTPRRLPLARSFHHHVYNAMDDILTVTPRDAEAFGAFELTRPVIAAIGDTRYDQVTLRSAEARKKRLVPEKILAGRKVLVAGSTWHEDEQVLLPACLKLLKTDPSVLLILVPHEPTVDHIEDLESELAGKAACIRFSALNEYAGEAVILVDSVGILLTLYASAGVAYIGGSFRQGIHNVLEAAVYGIPVLFGPRHGNSREPLRLADHGGGFVVNDAAELHRALENLFRDDTARAAAGERALRFVEANTGATEKFLACMLRHLHTTEG